MHAMTKRTMKFVFLVFSLLILPMARMSAAGQSPTPAQPPDDPLVRVALPSVTVTAQKEPEDIQKVPVSVTAVSGETIDQSGLRTVSDAAIFAPNTFFTDFTARKLSNARFRGIGASPANPAITTYIDGVPQLNANSSNIELLDIAQIEFVRGPQSALFGRNALGGIVNVTTRRPGSDKWTGGASLPFGNFSSWDLTGHASGPVNDTMSAGFAFSVAQRNGFTLNDVTGNDLDSRSAFSGKGQLFWKPNDEWQARLIVSGERARDGDYALNDLASLRQNPYHAARDFEGFTHRDIFGATIEAQRTSAAFTLSSTTGFLKWKTDDSTDLDYSPLPLATRQNSEDDFQFTEEVRIASATPSKLSDNATIKWQGGAFLFTQNYTQDAVNNLAPFVLSQFVNFPVTQHSPQSSLDDFGFGFFGQGTVTYKERLDLIAGLRMDYENKNADLNTFYAPPIAPPTVLSDGRSFGNVSPQFAVAYRLQPERTLYATVGRGYKAGGFNPASPAGNESYDEEQTWNVEGGVKTSWMKNRVAFNAAVFYIDWSNLQLNVPNPQVPAQLYIDNVGDATSAGFELELSARAAPGLDVFGTFGYTHARFSDGSTALGLDISGNDIPNTPDVTSSMGVQYDRNVRSVGTAYGRAEVVVHGAFKYDETNLQGQDAYALANFRGGVRHKQLFVEGWIRNAFDTTYIPVALPLPFAPSGYIGENGAPRTFGLNVGVTF
jgi:iron complex outermembrane receptor protein